MDAPETGKQGSVDRLYGAIKDMAITYRLRPGARLNEVELARALGSSRTPLREALNRLVAEGFLSFARGRGFFCRDFKPREIYELYQLRAVLETAATRLACEQATEAELDAIAKFLDESGPEPGPRSNQELVALDERFHSMIMALSRNAEMGKVLANINDKIKFFRWIAMEDRRAGTQVEHREILDALRAREPDRAADLMETHIDRRLDQITKAIKEGRARLNQGSPP